MRKETAIRKFNEFYDKALKSDYVKKPISWALYQTWKWFDEIENSTKPCKYYQQDIKQCFGQKTAPRVECNGCKNKCEVLR